MVVSGNGLSRATRITVETDGERRGDFRRFQESRDYDVADVVEHTDLAADLRDVVSGEVRFDEYAQVLYVTGGSIYQARPAGVVIPRDEDDVRAAVQTAAEYNVPVLPCEAGSSLAEQTVGPDCVVVDCSKHMDEIVRADPDARRAWAQPGVAQDGPDDHLADHDLEFAPDPASSNRATVGGGTGNNSTDAHSVYYGITDAYTEELRVVLADGSVVHTRDVVVGSGERDHIIGKDDHEAALYRTILGLVEDHEEEIERRYPSLKRSVSGYNLHKVVPETDDDEMIIDLSKLFVGTEGTLGVVVEATVSLVTVPEETALVLYAYDDLVEAMAAVPNALDSDASAVELMDDEVLRMAAEFSEYVRYVEEVPDGTVATLMLEFDSELHDDFEAVIREANGHFLRDGDPGSAAGDRSTATGDADDGGTFEAIEAYTPAAQADLWKLRKAAIPLLMLLPGDPKPYPFIEDASIPSEELVEYVQSFEDVLEDHGTSVAHFAHAESGTLHIRPILNLKENEGIEKTRAITDDVTDLVLDHRGVFSGEHGDGMARTEWNPKIYGPELWGVFKELKTAFDPEWRMNPGSVIYRNGSDDLGPNDDHGVGADMRENLRYGAARRSIELATALDFSDEGGFSHFVELCNGCGTCRQVRLETMCPTYRASKDEAETTRGRANMLHAAILGDLSDDETHSGRFQEEVFDLRVGCKSCQNDCPIDVDLAKLKAEVKHAHHAEAGASFRERLFANIGRLVGVGSALTPVSNWAVELPGAWVVMERLAGVAADRALPSFTRDTLESWMGGRRPRVPASEADYRVLLFPDTYANYVMPEIGKAAVRMLETTGVHVHLAEGVGPSSRAAYSGGFLDLARRRADHNIETLRPSVENGWSVVFVEPSDVVMSQDEYADLLPDNAVAPVVAAALGVMEFLDAHRLDENPSIRGCSADGDDAAGPAASTVADGGTLGSLTYHGYCNQKALNKDHHAVDVFQRVGYEVDPLGSSCCDMTGSFGYEAEHYDLSEAMGDILPEQVDDSQDDEVVTPGASCRTQLENGDDAAR